MIWKKQERQQKKNTKSRQGQQMGTPLGREAVISLLLGGILTLGIMQIWEWVKAYVRSNIKVR